MGSDPRLILISGAKASELRRSTGKNQKQLALDAEMSVDGVKRMEGGQEKKDVKVYLSTLTQVAKALRLEPADYIAAVRVETTTLPPIPDDLRQSLEEMGRRLGMSGIALLRSIVDEAERLKSPDDQMNQPGSK